MIVGAGVAAYSAINEAKKKKEAAKALENLETPELNNVAENQQVSTLGADLQREENARLSSTQVEALRESGTRGIVGGIGKVQANSQLLNSKIGADLDLQQKEIDANISNDDARIRGIREQRYGNDVAALSSQYSAAEQAQNMAIGNTFQAAGSAAQGIENYYNSGTKGNRVGGLGTANPNASSAGMVLGADGKYYQTK